LPPATLLAIKARRDHDRVVERVGEKGRRNDRAEIVVGVPASAVERLVEVR
jgi:hypothetical protein